MDINLTLLGQMFTFAIFVWFTLKYVWPPITKTMNEREKKIADGLAAAERGQRDLELARHKSGEVLKEAKQEAARIIEQANQRVLRILEEAQEQAQVERQRLLARAQQEIEQQIARTRRNLQHEVTALSLNLAEKIVQRTIDPSVHHRLVQQLVTENPL